MAGCPRLLLKEKSCSSGKNVYLHNSVCVYIGVEVGKNTNSAFISGCGRDNFYYLMLFLHVDLGGKN